MAEIEIPAGLYAEIEADLVSAQGGDEEDNQDGYWLGLARDAYDTSTSYLDSNIRKQWEASIAHQNNEHAPGSKYFTETYKARSKTFRPKTRTNNQSAEASFAKAMFSTTDLLNVEPENDNDPVQTASSEVIGHLMQHRLTKSIKWYLTAMGAYQDARVYGVCFTYQYWDFEEVTEDDEQPQGAIYDAMGDLEEPELEAGNPATNEYREFTEDQNPRDDDTFVAPNSGGDMRDRMPPKAEAAPRVRVLRDKPCCDSLPPENIRFEPNADWRDPVNTSPYVVRLVPMYAGEARHKAEANDWRDVTLAELIHSGGDIDERSDLTRKQRQGGERQDPADQDGGERNEFTMVWLHENFVRVDAQDYVFWTCGTGLLLSDPVPIEEAYPHLKYGERPITMGMVTIDAHKTYPQSPTRMIAPLQEQSNDIANQRMDNVRLVLNKRYILRRQQGPGGIDMAALARSTPGSSVMAGDPDRDVRVLETNDVTSSSYQEQDRLDLATDELSGTFSQQTVQNNRNLNETVGGMEMMNAGASDVTEYAIRTFIETWVEPTLSQLVRLEQYYETDEMLMVQAMDKSQKFQEFGQDVMLDELLRQELTINVNAGFGKTDPQKRLNSLTQAMQSIAFLPTAIPRLEEDEVIKEVFGNAGFRDGKRFFKPMEEFQKQMEGQPQGEPPDPAKMQELELKAQDQQFRHQMEQQRAQFEMEKWQSELAMKREVELMKLATNENITLEKLRTQLGIKEIDNQTKRDIAAGQQTNEQSRMLLERQNLKQGYDTYG